MIRAARRPRADAHFGGRTGDRRDRQDRLDLRHFRERRGGQGGESSGQHKVLHGKLLGVAAGGSSRFEPYGYRDTHVLSREIVALLTL